MSPDVRLAMGWKLRNQLAPKPYIHCMSSDHSRANSPPDPFRHRHASVAGSQEDHYTRSDKSYSDRFHKLSSSVTTVRLRLSSAHGYIVRAEVRIGSFLCRELALCREMLAPSYKTTTPRKQTEFTRMPHASSRGATAPKAQVPPSPEAAV